MGDTLIWVWCPYCHEGEGCVYENGKYTCPSTRLQFTEQESVEDSKKQ